MSVSHFRNSLLLTLLLASFAWAEKPAPLPETTPWKLEELNKPPKFEWLKQTGPVHSFTYEGESYQGKPTKVFAYFASPATVGLELEAKKFPAIVLVHGGGGAAFSQWAELWAKRGYVAVAMDLAGKGEGRKPLQNGGPDQSGVAKFDMIDSPVTEQWPYHAVANVIRAHSWLLERPEVDAQRTGLTGISWGGYLTCIVAGLDQRFQVAMPVYGCGFLRDNSVWVDSQFKKLTDKQADKWNRLWDPSQYIGSATMPVMFVNGSNDFAYFMDSYAKTCQLVKVEKNYSIQLRMRHGHIFDFPEFFLFMDQYLKNGEPLPVVETPTVKAGKVTAHVQTKTKLSSARLHYTTGPHVENKQREWITVPLTLDGGTISGKAPPTDATAWYVDVSDERKALISSQVMIP